MRWPSNIEAGLFVTDHVGLEFDRVLRVDYFRIRMVEVVKVVNLWIMEIAWSTQSRSSDSAITLLGNTTSIEAKVIDIVLFSLLLKFGKAGLCVTSFSRCRGRHITRRITSTDVVILVELVLTDLLERVWVSLSQ